MVNERYFEYFYLRVDPTHILFLTYGFCSVQKALELFGGAARDT